MLRVVAVFLAGLLACAANHGADFPPSQPVRRLLEQETDPRSGPPGFNHGVASGDLLPNDIILWTRFTPPAKEPPATIYSCTYRISQSPSLATILSAGTVQTSAARDFTIKVDAQIVPSTKVVKAGTRLYYGFACRDKAGTGYASPVGTFRLIPKATQTLNQLTWGLASCSNWGSGYFNAYSAIAAVTDLDFWVHVGDYIYEYGNGTYPEPGQQVREVLLADESVVLNAYRTRHALYKKDVSLQKLHQRAPLIPIWDDHDFADDAFVTGAANHDVKTEGTWKARVAAAAKAYFEWVPIREPATGLDITRKFEFGDLATLVMIETRVTGRTKQEPMFTPTLYALTTQTPYTSWVDSQFIAARTPFLKLLSNPKDEQMTPKGVTFLSSSFAASTAAKKPWQLLGNQVIMGQQNGPDLIGSAKANPAFKPLLAAAANTPAVQFLMASGQYRYPWNTDNWNGYNFQRQALLKKFAAYNNVIVMSGDSHNSWVNKLVPDGAAKPSATEFAGMSITSPGFESYGAAFVPFVADGFRRSNPNLVYNDLSRKGAVVFRATKTKLHAEFVYVSTIASKAYKAACGKAFDVPAANNGGVVAGACFLAYTATDASLGLAGANAAALLSAV